MSAGESAGEQAARIRQKAEKLRTQLEKADRDAELWSRGEEGERRLLELLSPLPGDEYFRLVDRRRPNSDGNIDCVVAGRFGVVVVDAKNWQGQLVVKGTSLMQGGWQRSAQVTSLRDSVSQIQRSLMDLRHVPNIPVWPVMCFVGEAKLGSRHTIDYVQLLDGPDLVPLLRSLEKRFDAHQADAIVRRLLEVLPPRSGQNPLPELREPTETLVFLRSSKKPGRHRLYVKDRDGKEVGHFDVMTGRVECTDAPWSAVLSQLLPHYLDGEAAMIAQADLPSGTTRGIRRYVDSLLRRPRQRSVQPLIVGRHWKQYGKERLYVDRLEANGSRNPLGWFDLSQQYRSARGDAAGLVAFCGTRFKAVKA